MLPKKFKILIFLKQRLKKKKIDLLGLKKRFSFLHNNVIEHHWTSVAYRTWNGTQLFKKISNYVFCAEYFNGVGIGFGTLIREQSTLKVLNINTKKKELINLKTKAKILPSDIILNFAVKLRLIY